MNNAFKSFITRGGMAALLFFGVALFTMAGCSQDEPPMVSVSMENHQIGIESQSIQVEVRSNSRWTAAIEQGDHWVALSHTKGYGTEILHLNVDEYNDSPNPRTAIVRITTTGANSTSAQILLTQSASNSTLMISPEAIEVDNKEQTVGMVIASNDDWTITVDKPDFLAKALSKTSGNGNATINIPVAANPGHDQRAITLTVTAGTGARTVIRTMTITQDGVGAPSLFLSETSLEYPASGGTSTVLAITNIQGDLQATCDFSWCVPTVSGNKVTIKVASNGGNASRDAIVTVVGHVDGTAVSRQIRITQAGLGSPVITLLTGDIQVANAGQNDILVGYIKSDSGISVTVRDYPSWITNVVKGKETGVNGTITFDVADNADVSMRQGVINLVATLGSESLVYPVNVIQAGVGDMVLSLHPDYANIVAEGVTKFKIVSGHISEPTADVQVVVSEGPTGMVTGLSVVMDTDGTFDVKFKVSANTGADTRTATILVTASKGAQTVVGYISVIQAGIGSPDITVVSDLITIPQAGADPGDGHGTQILGATKDTGIEIVEIGGFKATPSGDPYDFIEITAGANTASTARTQDISLVVTQGGASQVIVLQVIQPGTGSPQLTIPHDHVTLSDAAQDVSLVVIKEGTTTYAQIDGTWPSWITDVTPGTDALTFKVTKNSGAERSGSIILKAENGNETILYTIGVVQEGIAAPALALATGEVFVTAIQTDVEVPFIGNATDCTFEYGIVDKSWIAVAVGNDPLGTGKFDLTITPNTGAASRSQTVTINVTRGDGQHQTLSLKVTQAGVGAPNVVAGATALQFGPDEIATVEVHLMNEGATAADHAAVTVASKPDWITTGPDAISTDNDQLKFSVAKNTTASDRSGVIVLSATKGGQKAMISISVTQAAYDPLAASLSMASIDMGSAATAGSGPSVLILHLGDNDAGTAAQSSVSWLSGNIIGDEMQVEVTKNDTGAERTGVLTVMVEHAENGTQQYLTLVVNQAGTSGPGVVAGATALQFGPDGENNVRIHLMNEGATVADHAVVAIESKPSWIANASVNSDYDELKFRVTKNATAGDRSGVIVLSATKGGQKAMVSISVLQSAYGPLAASLSMSSVTVGADAAPAGSGPSAMILHLGTNTADVKHSSDGSWLSGDVVGGKVQVGVTKNDTGAVRTGVLTVEVLHGENNTLQYLTLVVNQEPAAAVIIPDLLVSPMSVTMAATGGDSQNITMPNFINGNYTDIHAVASADWITEPAVDAVNGTAFRINVAANDGAARNGEVQLIVTKNDETQQTIDIKVNQAGVAAILDLVPATTSVNFTATGGVTVVDLHRYTDAAAYTISAVSSNTEWLTVSNATEPDEIEITAAANTSAAARTPGKVTVTVIKSDGEPQTIEIVVNQQGTSPVADLVPNHTGVMLSDIAGPSQIIYLNGYDASLYTIAQTIFGNWINVYHSGNTLEVSASSNNTGASARTGTATLTVTKLGGTTQTIVIDVTQAGMAPSADLVPNHTGVMLSDDANTIAETETVELQGYSSDYTVTQTASDSWISVSRTDGVITIGANSDNTGVQLVGSVTINVTRPDRTLQSPITVNVTQAAAPAPATIADLVPAATDVNFTAATGTVSVELHRYTDNTEYTAISAVSSATGWLSVTNSTPEIIEITAAENTSTAARTPGKITVTVTKAGGATQTITIDVTQTGASPVADLVAATTDMNFTAAGDTAVPVELHNYSAADYPTVTAVSSSTSWLTAAFNAGNIEITATANTSASPRTPGKITVTVSKRGGGTQTITINVTQEGTSPVLDLVPDHSGVILLATPTAENVELHHYTDAASYTIKQTVSANWISADVTSIPGTVIINAKSDNTTGAERKGSVILTVLKAGGTTQTIEINVTQEG